MITRAAAIPAIIQINFLLPPEFFPPFLGDWAAGRGSSSSVMRTASLVGASDGVGTCRGSRAVANSSMVRMRPLEGSTRAAATAWERRLSTVWLTSTGGSRASAVSRSSALWGRVPVMQR